MPDEEYQEIVWQGKIVSYRRLSDGAFIPLSDDNADYCRLKERMDDGYMPRPFEPVPGGG
jgi:hypothetical protein